MLQIMQEWDVRWVMWGDAFILDAAFTRSGSQFQARHPLDRWKYVLNALYRDRRFEHYLVKINVYNKHGNVYDRHVRAFKIKT